MTTDRIARVAVVHGLVQGVFFRASCQQVALDLGVDGWVSNEYDGTVRVHAEGPSTAVRDLVDWLHRGPPRASVQRVVVDDTPAQGLRGFEVR